ncbi:hypothetical protein [Sphingobacterium corticibacter]|uniref:hypothetical protein n=1 Tax=Sphingobacterium corticibacter TaxID=2171749 RepID=UPI0013FDB834|nr:hypothetical protein [Sphingobacterium corticibacter]
MKERKDKKKSKYSAPIIKIDAIATEHWIAANSQDIRDTEKEKSLKKENDRDNKDESSW